MWYRVLQESELTLLNACFICRLYLTIQECISATCLAQFVATGLAQCIIGVYVIYVGSDFSRLLNSFMFFGAVTFEILILCYYGDLYCRANEFLIDAIYDCNWMDRDERFKKALLLLLQRSQQTNCLRAGNFIPIRLPTFVKVNKLYVCMNICVR